MDEFEKYKKKRKILKEINRILERMKNGITFMQCEVINIFKLFYDYPNIMKMKEHSFHCTDEKIKYDTFEKYTICIEKCFKKSEQLIPLFVELKQLMLKCCDGAIGNNMDKYNALIFEIKLIKCLHLLRMCKMYELFMYFVGYTKIYDKDFNEQELEIGLLNYKFTNYIPNLESYPIQKYDLNTHKKFLEKYKNNLGYMNNIDLYKDVPIFRTIIEMVHVIQEQYELLLNTSNDCDWFELKTQIPINKKQLKINIQEELNNYSPIKININNLVWFCKSSYNKSTNNNIFITNYKHKYNKETITNEELNVDKEPNIDEEPTINEEIEKKIKIKVNIKINESSAVECTHGSIKKHFMNDNKQMENMQTVEDIEQQMRVNNNINFLSETLTKKIPSKYNKLYNKLYH
jgi:hypothetical protein